MHRIRTVTKWNQINCRKAMMRGYNNTLDSINSHFITSFYVYVFLKDIQG